ncbi:type ISP restriction/modification enzyme [Streptomyces sp. NPDC001268]|uniref:type ISP restriction/modification enzyme n=1 Tax=Streptomyces sp. NPDC001268 TaxID=3364553 RepID=UPI0036ACF5B7
MPLTDDVHLWNRAVRIGRRVLWLHTYGDRFADHTDSRPRDMLRLPSGRPRCVVGHVRWSGVSTATR